MGLELYAKIEQYLDFKTEVSNLHNTFIGLVIKQNSKNVIDIGCGQGAFLELLQKHNITNFGVDLSQTQTQIAIDKKLNAKCCDISQINEKFDCATAIFDVVNYIHPDDLDDFFQNVSNLISPNGSFIFDVNTKFAFEEIVEGAISIDKDEIFISIDAHFEKNILNTNIVVFESSSSGLYIKQKDTVIQYFHSKDSIIKSAKKAGFCLTKTIGFNLHGFDKDDKIIFIFKK